MKQKFNITGMTCSACSARVEKVSNALPGMHRASVNLLSNSMTAEYDENVHIVINIFIMGFASSDNFHLTTHGLCIILTSKCLQLLNKFSGFLFRNKL